MYPSNISGQKKDRVLLDHLFDLKNKEQELQDQNKELRKKLQETSLGENSVHMSWLDGGQSSSNVHAIEPYPGLVQHPDHDSSMQIGYHQSYMDQLNT